MSHFNRWWSKQRILDKEAKRFSHTVWNEAAKPYQVTIDKLTAELAEVREEAKVWQDRYRKRGYVMDEHTKALERAEVAEAELARYKQGVEVEGYVIGVPSDIDADMYFASGWSRELGKLRGKVRVLVMKEVEG